MSRSDLVGLLPKWWKPPLKGAAFGCLNCGPKPDELPMDAVIAVGFGDASLYRDGERIMGEDPGMDFDDCPTVAQAEAIAAADPDHDWRIMFEAPLSMNEYQRHGKERWVLIRKGMGFA